MPEPIIRRSTFAELADWNDHLDRLAERAERASAAPAAAVTLAERASLAAEAARLLWLALTPAVIAASCRATSLLGEPVLAGVAPLDQQLLAAHALRDGGLLDQQVQGQREPVVDVGKPDAEEVPAVEEQEEPDVEEVPVVVEEEPDVDVGEPVVEEQEELLEVDHQGDEEQQIEEQPAAAEWLGAPELSALLGVTANTVRSWSAKGWLVLGDHFIQDPSDRRRHLFNVERCRQAASDRSRKLRGQEARTVEGAEARNQLRAERLRQRRQAKRNAEPVGAAAEPERITEPVGAAAEPERLTEPVGQEPEQAGGGRIEQLIEALLLEVRGQG